ncbi:hypothetical protein B0H17DRAFT_1142583 [Mycena rosella]|uniref:Uncharacterized protein n=1 Tax=Mycena rosella TaxID=1033263 RepID=A0AAD7CXF5_MYCRO|nr:hypothetical protein B0H17DRAFT_1142583 [Mycena rosella]
MCRTGRLSRRISDCLICCRKRGNAFDCLSAFEFRHVLLQQAPKPKRWKSAVLSRQQLSPSGYVDCLYLHIGLPQLFSEPLMFNNSTGFHFRDGTFYNVSGNVNLETHQDFTFQHPRLDNAASRPLAPTWAESPSRELSAVTRNPRNEIRPAPYGRSARPPLASSGFPSKDLSSGPMVSSSRQPGFGHHPIPEFVTELGPLATTASHSIDPRFPAAGSLSPYHIDYPHCNNLANLPSFLTQPSEDYPTAISLDWTKDEWLPDFQIPNREDLPGSDGRGVTQYFEPVGYVK